MDILYAVKWKDIWDMLLNEKHGREQTVRCATFGVESGQNKWVVFIAACLHEVSWKVWINRRNSIKKWLPLMVRWGWSSQKKEGSNTVYVYPVVLFLLVNHVNYFLFRTKNKLHVCKIAFQWQVSIYPRAGKNPPTFWSSLVWTLDYCLLSGSCIWFI